jgi:small-conductance mechanosensitive channel
LFLNIIKYVFVFFLLLIVISSYFGTWLELGLTAGLLTAAVGWALQKPITGMAAWIMIAIKRPFGIGDRVVIKDIKGDIIDITLTHIYLAEVGGTIDGEEQSGRITMIPNSLLFEVEIINYTKQNDYILDEITTSITYESNLKKAEKIMNASVEKIMQPFHQKFPKKIPCTSHIRLDFKESGMAVIVRYYTLTRKRNAISTDIRREIFTRINKTSDVDIAYPHAEIIMGKTK